MTQLPVASEHLEQVTVCDWLTLKKLLYFAIPNGGARHIATARFLKAEGVQPGIPDLFIPVLAINNKYTFVEMKKVKGGVVKLIQKIWHEHLRENGFNVILAFGAEDAINQLSKLYL